MVNHTFHRVFIFLFRFDVTAHTLRVEQTRRVEVGDGFVHGAASGVPRLQLQLDGEGAEVSHLDFVEGHVLA